jgi:hypothetical protein
MIAMPCMPPGALCALRGGVLVITETPARCASPAADTTATIMRAAKRRRLRIVRAAVAHREHVEGSDPAVFGEADLHAAPHARPRAPDGVLFLAADAHHHRRVQLLRKQRGNDHRHPPVILLPNPPPVYSLMNTILSSMFIHFAMAGTVCAVLCVPECRKQLAVLPVSHRRARLQALVAHIGRREGLVQNSAAFLKPASMSPYDHSSGAWPIGNCPWSYSAKSSSVHFSSVNCGPGRRRRGPHPHIAVLARIRAARPQALQRIDAKRQRLKIDLDLSIASAQVNSSTAATARIGSPWYMGSLVSARSPHLLALITRRCIAS